MTKIAVADPSTGRIDHYLDLADGLVALPFVEVEEAVGDNQVLGPPVVTIEATRVVATRSPVRALSGLVAIIDEDGTIGAVRDLGSDLVQVADNVKPYREVRPDFDPVTQVREGPAVTIGDALVERVWTVREKTAEERADYDEARKEAAIATRFGDLGLAVALDQENRLRKLEGEEPLSLEAFKTREKAKL